MIVIGLPTRFVWVVQSMLPQWRALDNNEIKTLEITARCAPCNDDIHRQMLV